MQLCYIGRSLVIRGSTGEPRITRSLVIRGSTGEPRITSEKCSILILSLSCCCCWSWKNNIKNLEVVRKENVCYNQNQAYIVDRGCVGACHQTGSRIKVGKTDASSIASVHDGAIKSFSRNSIAIVAYHLPLYAKYIEFCTSFTRNNLTWTEASLVWVGSDVMLPYTTPNRAYDRASMLLWFPMKKSSPVLFAYIGWNSKEESFFNRVWEGIACT